MASLFSNQGGECRLLDAGAGIGSLSAAFLERWRSGHLHVQSVSVDAVEIDPTLTPHLSETLRQYNHGSPAQINIIEGDFVLASAQQLSGDLFSGQTKKYTHIILNPPYKKISNDSAHRLALRRAGIETVNLYSAFVALAVSLAAPGGQVVAIIPRSFCNGPYYRPFREFLLARAAIRRIHLFGARDKAFQDDAVLQENMIIHLERGAAQGAVTISTSTDDTLSDLAVYEHPFARIVLPDDPERFVHVPTSPEQDAIAGAASLRHTLEDLGVQVSTGPVVDFRLRAHLRDRPGPDTAPLLYPAHLGDGEVRWPLEETRKPNAIARNADTERWLYPNGSYCVVRRFSSKEERRRIVASVTTPARFGDATLLGFENHLNLFHDHKRGLPAPLAWGLATFLNSTAVDEHFRRFNGHTQVNATDLRMMKYPSREALLALGQWAAQQPCLTQALIDAQVEAQL